VQNTLVLRFNKTLLKGDAVAITRVQTPIPPPPQSPSPWIVLSAAGAAVAAGKPPPPPPIGPIVDSSLMHVCTGNIADCTCMSWMSLGNRKAKPLTGPWVCEIPAEGGLPRVNQSTRGDIWAPVPIKLLSDAASISVDTSKLNVSTGGIHAVKFGWSFSGGKCCIDLPSNTNLAPCIPGSCGIMTRDSLLPLNPFFAMVVEEKCQCPLPQTCDE
jgi:hypothetical protein